MIESDDSLVGRTGNWTVQSAGGASGGSYLYSSGSPDDVLTLYFEGTYISVGYVQSPALDTLAIEVDNTVLRTVITTSGSTVYGSQSVISYLNSGLHTLRVYAQQGTIAIDNFYTLDPNAATATPIPSSTASPIASFTPTPTADTSTWNIYDDTDTHLAYGHGSWTPANDIVGAYQQTLTSSSDFAANITFYFEGTGFEVIYTAGPTGGQFGITIDSRPPTLIDNTSSELAHSRSVTFGALPTGQHEVVITIFSGTFPLDALRINETPWHSLKI